MPTPNKRKINEDLASSNFQTEPTALEFPSSIFDSPPVTKRSLQPVSDEKKQADSTTFHFTTSPQFNPPSPASPPMKYLPKHDDRLSLAREKINIAKSAQGKFHKRPWENLFDGNICLGEDHSDITPKKFIIENLSLLKANGYDCIFMEHLSRREHQSLLDEYFISGVMDPELSKYLDDLNEGHMEQFNDNKQKQVKAYNFKTIIIEAAKVGIKIVALEESMIIYQHPNYQSGENRMLILNSIFLDKIAELKKECGHREPKWLAFIGSGHVNTHENVPGIADIVDCQDLIIRDINDNEIEYLVSTEKKEFFKIESEMGYVASMVLSKKWHDSSMKFHDNLALPDNNKIPSIPNTLSLTNNPDDLNFGIAHDVTSRSNVEYKGDNISSKNYPGNSVIGATAEISSTTNNVKKK